MAKQEALSAWVEENVPDESVWCDSFVCARKEETRAGSRIHVTQSVRAVREVTLTGAELKSGMAAKTDAAAGIVVAVLGAAIAALTLLLRRPMAASTGAVVVGLLIGLGTLAGGVYMIVSGKKKAPVLAAIASMEALTPYIEDALAEKAYNEELQLRKKELGDAGAAYAGYAVIPARLAAAGQFEKMKANYGVSAELQAAMTAAAIAVSEEKRVLRRIV